MDLKFAFGLKKAIPGEKLLQILKGNNLQAVTPDDIGLILDLWLLDA